MWIKNNNIKRGHMTDQPSKSMLAKIFTILSFIAIGAALVMVAIMLCSCTTSVTTITTRGTAQDVVDENQSATPNVSPTLSVPLK